MAVRISTATEPTSPNSEHPGAGNIAKAEKFEAERKKKTLGSNEGPNGIRSVGGEQKK